MDLGSGNTCVGLCSPRERVEVAHAKFHCVVVDYGFLTSFQFIFISSVVEQVEDETT